MVRRPSMEHMPAGLAQAARSVAGTLAAAGWRAWLVGGAVRDLALGIEPHDADLASAAPPAELERLFARTYLVGKAFGTVVVRCGALDVQVTTFRAEADYDDARRPARVRFSGSLEEDAQRRDFTCNALYLDPLTDELRDPEGGLADLERGSLRCVGEAGRRFAEDGLRLLRLARLAAEHGLAIEAASEAGARASLDALRGVSPERVLAELTRMTDGRAPGRAFGFLHGLGVLARLPGFPELRGAGPEARLTALERLEPGGSRRAFAVLFWPFDAGEEHALDCLRALRPPRELTGGVQRVWRTATELADCLRSLARGEARRSCWVRLARAEELADAWAGWRAWHPGELEQEDVRLRARITALTPGELRPAPLITSAELAHSGIPRGPRWAELLRAAEDAQLDGELRTHEDARAWLARQADA